jgi:hypothetical protein
MRCSGVSEPVDEPTSVRMQSCQKPTMCRDIDRLLVLQQRKLAFKLTVLYTQGLEFLTYVHEQLWKPEHMTALESGLAPVLGLEENVVSRIDLRNRQRTRVDITSSN